MRVSSLALETARPKYQIHTKKSTLLVRGPVRFAERCNTTWNQERPVQWEEREV